MKPEIFIQFNSLGHSKLLLKEKSTFSSDHSEISFFLFGDKFISFSERSL